MKWGMRVVKYKINGPKGSVDRYAVLDVLYDMYGYIKAYNMSGVRPKGESLDELISKLKIMLKTAEAAKSRVEDEFRVLEESELPQEGPGD